MATIYDWATQASGSTIVGSLTATAAEYQGQITIGTVTYGLIKYTFSGSPTLSSVIAGHRLTITGMTNSLNNASGMVVYSADDAADTITIRSTTRTDATADETGASGTGTVTTAGAAVQKPSDSYIEQGFAAPAKPSDGYWNWVISQMATIVQSAASRAQNVYSGPSAITSSSYADLDGAGVAYGLGATASDQSWTASANDGAYESISGVNVDPVIKDGSDVFYFFTTEQGSGQARPNEFQIELDTTPIATIASNTGGYATDTQSKYSYSACHVESSVSTGSRDFDLQAKRYTGLTAVQARAYAIELPPEDDSANSMVRAFSTGITEGTFGGTYADMTGFTTGSVTFQNGNKALVLFGAAIYTTSGGSSCDIKILKDATQEAEWTNLTQANAGTFDIGQMTAFARVVDVTGGHTIKAQGLSSSSSKYSGGNAGYFGAIELPAVYNGDTLLRDTQTISSAFTNTSYAELATSGSVTTNGHRVLLMISGKFAFGAAASVHLQFKVDGSTFGSEYELTRAGAYGTPVCIMLLSDALSAGSHTFSIEGKTSASTITPADVQFAAIELPITDPNAGNAPTVTLTDTTGKKVELTYTGSVNASNAALSFQVTENIDGGGAAADGNEFTFTPQSGQDTPFTFRTVVDAPASGSTAVYKLQGKIASGTANVSAGDFMAREIQADGS